MDIRFIRIFSVFACVTGILVGQESAGQADVGFQQYYLASGSERVSNVSGLTLNLVQFIPKVGLLSASLAPALSEGRFRTGDNFLQLKGVPWKGQHWSFNVGDFRLPGQALEAPFNNLVFPEITGRGVLLEASHGGRAAGFFVGAETILNHGCHCDCKRRRPSLDPISISSSGSV